VTVIFYQLTALLLACDACVCLQGLYEQSCTSGSGSGVPLLAQRTVAHSIHLCEIIGETALFFLILIVHCIQCIQGPAIRCKAILFCVCVHCLHCLVLVLL